MKKYIAMDSEYCSMGRWISIIVAHYLNMKLYEDKDLLQLIDSSYTVEDLKELEKQLQQQTLEEAKDNILLKAIHEDMIKAINKAIELGPCIIHEKAATYLLKDHKECLKVLLYNTDMHHRIKRARSDKTYDLSSYNDDEVVDFINCIDKVRKNYHDSVCDDTWGNKYNYDLCLDSDLLSREKCAQILIEAMKDSSLDLEECQNIIHKRFI